MADEPSGAAIEDYFVEDRTFPATRDFPASFEITDEIYQFKDFSRDRVRVLMSIDPTSVDLTKKTVHRTDKDFAVTWVRNYGKGHVFYSALGHGGMMYAEPVILQLYGNAMAWALAESGQNCAAGK